MKQIKAITAKTGILLTDEFKTASLTAAIMHRIPVEIQTISIIKIELFLILP